MSSKNDMSSNNDITELNPEDLENHSRIHVQNHVHLRIHVQNHIHLRIHVQNHVRIHVHIRLHLQLHQGNQNIYLLDFLLTAGMITKQPCHLE